MARAPVLSRSTATIARASAGRVAGIATIALVSVGNAANGVAKAAVRTPASGSARFGTATIEFTETHGSMAARLFGRPALPLRGPVSARSLLAWEQFLEAVLCLIGCPSVINNPGCARPG